MARHRKASAATERVETNLLELIQLAHEWTGSDAEAVALVAELINSGRVRFTHESAQQALEVALAA